MRSTDRDYFLSTLAVLHSQRHSLVRVLQDMDIRLSELEDSLIMMFDEREEFNIDLMLDDMFTAGKRSVFNHDDEDDIIYDTLRKKKVCTCDDCWGVKNDDYEHRMD